MKIQSQRELCEGTPKWSLVFLRVSIPQDSAPQPNGKLTDKQANTQPHATMLAVLQPLTHMYIYINVYIHVYIYIYTYS